MPILSTQVLNNIANAVNEDYFKRTEVLVENAASEGRYSLSIYKVIETLEMPANKQLQAEIANGIVDFWLRRGCSANVTINPNDNSVHSITISWRY